MFSIGRRRRPTPELGPPGTVGNSSGATRSAVLLCPRENYVTRTDPGGERSRPIAAVEEIEEVVENHRKVCFVRSMERSRDDNFVPERRLALR